MWKLARLFLRTHLRAMRIAVSVFTVCWVATIIYIGFLVGWGHFSGTAPIRSAGSDGALSSFGAAVFLILAFGGMAGLGILLWACMLRFFHWHIEASKEQDEHEHS
jgi:hypothetical protein